MTNTIFSLAENNLMVIYNSGSRLDLIADLYHMLTFLTEDETELHELTCATIGKLKSITDLDYAALDLDPDGFKGW